MVFLPPKSKLILHFDGDAFFVSVMQVVFPYLKNKPVVTGKEKGVVTALSYEAKRLGIKRGMTIYQVKKFFPQCQIVETDFSIINLFSQRMFNLIKSFNLPTEIYSIDEAFLEINSSERYLNIAQKIKEKINQALGLSVSIGISFNKSLAKIASYWAKPGRIIPLIDSLVIERFLKKTPLVKVWGIGKKTATRLNQFGLQTAFDLVKQKEVFIKFYFDKNVFDIWKELKGEKIFSVDQKIKTDYQTIIRSQSFRLTKNKDFLWSRVVYHTEEAFDFIREFNLYTKKLKIFLKDEFFIYHQAKITFDQPVNYPFFIHSLLKKAFEKIYQQELYYRAVGCYLTDLKNNQLVQLSFSSIYSSRKEENVKKLYSVIKNKKIGFGVYLFDKEHFKNQSSKKTLNLPLIHC